MNKAFILAEIKQRYGSLRAYHREAVKHDDFVLSYASLHSFFTDGGLSERRARYITAFIFSQGLVGVEPPEASGAIKRRFGSMLAFYRQFVAGECPTCYKSMLQYFKRRDARNLIYKNPWLESIYGCLVENDRSRLIPVSTLLGECYHLLQGDPNDAAFNTRRLLQACRLRIKPLLLVCANGVADARTQARLTQFLRMRSGGPLLHRLAAGHEIESLSHHDRVRYKQVIDDWGKHDGSASFTIIRQPKEPVDADQ